MHYKIIKETKPNLKNYGRYKAVAVHYQTVDTARLCREIQDNCSLKKSDVEAVLAELSELLVRHLQDGHRVRLDGIGLLKLEIESDKVDRAEITASTCCQRVVRATRPSMKASSWNQR